ncbi:MAG: hypothetical protein JJ909_20215 [Roseivirga sp.]|nr:hypothetical protein [Allomuricauda sp.]MBO6533551.1 hypothetical protein [Allomuricauda sp.]MBO6763289.1 hypothetical protein [Roseivirga sp.]MBO6845848.1 hypothetical protein [Allomuricauda sp.]
MGKFRVKLHDENNNSWELVSICHIYPDVHRWVALKDIRATHFISKEDARKALDNFQNNRNNAKYSGTIIEI